MEGEGMRIYERIDKQTRTKLNDLKNGNRKGRPKSKTRNRRNKERLTERDIKELMGQYEPTFRKHRGAWRSK